VNSYVREDAGYDTDQLAEMVGISSSTLSRWESGKRARGAAWQLYCTILYKLQHRQDPGLGLCPRCATAPAQPPAPAIDSVVQVRLPARGARRPAPPSAVSETNPAARLMARLSPELAATVGFDPGPRPVQHRPFVWWRLPDRFERARNPYVIALRMNLPLAAAASGALLPSAPLEHHSRPDFNAKTTGLWLVDLTDYDPGETRLPVPFTSDGQHPTGPDWYTTDAVRTATLRGSQPRPTEGWLCPEKGRAYLAPWYKHVRETQLELLRRLDVDTDDNAEPEPMLRSLQKLPEHPDRLGRGLLRALADAEAALLTSGEDTEPAWLPAARLTLQDRAAAELHRKLVLAAETTRLLPLAATCHTVWFGTPTTDIFQLIARTRGEQRPSGFRLSGRPGGSRLLGHAPLDAYSDLVADLDLADAEAPAALEALIADPLAP